MWEHDARSSQLESWAECVRPCGLSRGQRGLDVYRPRKRMRICSFGDGSAGARWFCAIGMGNDAVARSATFISVRRLCKTGSFRSLRAGGCLITSARCVREHTRKSSTVRDVSLPGRPAVAPERLCGLSTKIVDVVIYSELIAPFSLDTWGRCAWPTSMRRRTNCRQRMNG